MWREWDVLAMGKADMVCDRERRTAGRRMLVLVIMLSGVKCLPDFVIRVQKFVASIYLSHRSIL